MNGAHSALFEEDERERLLVLHETPLEEVEARVFEVAYAQQYSTAQCSRVQYSIFVHFARIHILYIYGLANEYRDTSMYRHKYEHISSVHYDLLRSITLVGTVRVFH